MDKLILLVSITNAMPYRNPPYRDLTDKAREIAHRYDSVKSGSELFDIIVECQVILEKVHYKVIGLDAFMHSEDQDERPQIWTKDVYFQQNNALVLLSRTMISPIDFEPKMNIIYAPYVPQLIAIIRRHQENSMIERKEAYSIRCEMLLRSRGTMTDNLIRAFLHGSRA